MGFVLELSTRGFIRLNLISFRAQIQKNIKTSPSAALNNTFPLEPPCGYYPRCVRIAFANTTDLNSTNRTGGCYLRTLLA